MSQKMGLKPLFAIASAVEIQVLAGKIISDPFFIFKAFNAISKASVPFATEIQYLDLTNLQNFPQNL